MQEDSDTYLYVFTAAPQFGTNPTDDIFEKARKIVACIRHGEYHAQGTKILYPLSVLSAMTSNSMRPHPYSSEQYSILAESGIVRIEPVETFECIMYGVEWIDTTENNMAANVARQFLLGWEPYAETGEELEARKVMLSGEYHYSSEQRRLKGSSRLLAKQPFNRLIELMSGVKV